MKISVVIPTYNRKHTLLRALDSVLAQSYQPFEIIVIDDGSSDGTIDMIKSKYPSLKLLESLKLSKSLKGYSPKGVSIARNVGIKKSKGDWISLLDSDDEWVPDKLIKQVQLLKKNEELLFCHTNEIWIRNGIRVNQHKKHQKYGGYIFKECLDICRISPSSALIHKSIFEDIGLFDESLKVCEDYDLWLRIALRYSFKFLSDKLIVKRGGHEDQLSHKFWGMDRWRVYALEKLLRGDDLNPEQRSWVTEMLIEKSGVLIQGFAKRDKNEEAEVYRNLVANYS